MTTPYAVDPRKGVLFHSNIFQQPSDGHTPAISGTTNGASFQQAYAPGMILSIFGSNLGAATGIASGVPLSPYMQSF